MKGLVLEGGSMRGMFSAGIMDVFMENGIEFDGAVGVSAGAVFGCNYKSRQIGRAIRYNKRFCNDPRYASFRSLIKTGDIYGADFCYRQIPDELDVFDTETFRKNPMDFYVVATDMDTGKPVYHKCKDGKREDIEWMRASASMPLVSRTVKIGKYSLSDGGTSDSIPVKFMIRKGYDKIVVILTQPEGFVKQKNKLIPIIKMTMRDKPNFIRAISERHKMYNKTLACIKKLEEKGRIFVIRPPEALNIGAVEHNPDELERVYRIGRKVGEEYLDKVKEYLL
ncbi:MAG: patatin family protein [Oscillospiraceae bacterium]|nr:patatin family protein [Oscillospiraceae bacterium]